MLAQRFVHLLDLQVRYVSAHRKLFCTTLFLCFSLKFGQPVAARCARRLLFSYEVLTPAALNFFVSYADGAVESLWSIDQYFEFVLVLMLSTGLSFQARTGGVSPIPLNTFSNQQLTPFTTHPLCLVSYYLQNPFLFRNPG